MILFFKRKLNLELGAGFRQIQALLSFHLHFSKIIFWAFHLDFHLRQAMLQFSGLRRGHQTTGYGSVQAPGSHRQIVPCIKVVLWNILASKKELSVTKGLFTWRKVVPGRRVTLLPKPSFTEHLYEKSCPC